MKPSISKTLLSAVLSHFVRLTRAECQRLFAKNLLAGVGRGHYPWLVQLVGERYIDGLNRWIVEQLLVRSIRLRDIKLPRPGASSREIAAGQGNE